MSLRTALVCALGLALAHCAPEHKLYAAKPHPASSTDFGGDTSAPAVSAPLTKAEPPATKEPAPAPVTIPPVPDTEGGWKPEQVSLQSTEGAPNGVGLLLYILPGKADDGDLSLLRCTGFLKARDQLVTNGHCDIPPGATGYFFVLGPKGTEFRKVKALIKKVYTPGKTRPDGRIESSHKPDAALLQLESEFGAEIKPLVLDLVGPLSFQQLMVYSVLALPPLHPDPKKPHYEDGRYRIGAQSCAFFRHEQLFPYNPEESPEILRYYICPMIEGDSGSPLIGKDGTVVAIHQAAGDDPPKAADVLLNEHRTQQPFEQVQESEGTNVRCVDFLGGTDHCTPFSEDEVKKRFAETQTKAMDSIKQLAIENPERYQTDFEIDRYVLATDPRDFNKQFDVLYYPKCLHKGETPSHLVIPERHVELTYDEWAVPTVTDMYIRLSPMTPVEPNQGVHFHERVDWATSPGTFAPDDVKNDPRVQFKNPFWIDLPECAG